MILALAAALVIWTPVRASLYCYYNHEVKHSAHFKYGCQLPKGIKVAEPENKPVYGTTDSGDLH